MPRPHGTYLLLGKHNRFLTSWGLIRETAPCDVCVWGLMRAAVSARGVVACSQGHEKMLMMGFDLSVLDIGTVSPRVTNQAVSLSAKQPVCLSSPSQAASLSSASLSSATLGAGQHRRQCYACPRGCGCLALRVESGGLRRLKVLSLALQPYISASTVTARNSSPKATSAQKMNLMKTGLEGKCR